MMEKIISKQSFALTSIATVLLAADGLAQPGPEPRPGLSRGEQVMCTGTDDVVIRDRLIETDGIGVFADGVCDVEIHDSHIVAGDVGIHIEGNSDVVLYNSYVRGGDKAVVVTNNGDLEYSDSTLDGDVHTSEQGDLTDLGNNRVTGKINSSERPMADASGADIDISGALSDAASVEIGPDGIRVQDESGERVVVGADGRTVEAESGSESVNVTDGNDSVRVEDERGNTVAVDRDEIDIDHRGEGTSAVVKDGWIELREGDQQVEISGDWRARSGSSYASADTERVLVELGATEGSGEISIDLEGDVLFDFDSAAIRPDAAAKLEKVAHVVRERATGEVRVVGHTDSRGSEDYNLKLSRQRAMAVMDWLHTEAGIPLELMVGRGMGARQPVAHNTDPDGSDNPQGRARNRRVEVIIESGQ